MFEGTVTFVRNNGYFFVEQDVTHTSVFIHQKNVRDRRYLHVGDRVKFNLAPCAKDPTRMEGVQAEYIVHTIARQTSGRAVRP